MQCMLKIAQGAEAIVYRDNNRVLKERFSKKYRLAHLDESLRKFRTRREAKILGKLEDLRFPSPHLREFSDKRMSITMDFVPGEKLKDILKKGDGYQELSKAVGKGIGKLHVNDIVHGDLTTSNMIQHAIEKEVYFLDFGLATFSNKIEDKAVDLFLLDRALESTHFEIYPDIFKSVLEGYGEVNPDTQKVMERFKAVKARGRNKGKD